MITLERPSVLTDEPEHYSIDIKQDSLPPITIGLYEAFMARGRKGIHALAVYTHLLYTYRLQHTDTIWANNVYLMGGLKMCEHNIKTSKTILKAMGLIETIRNRDGAGRISKTYLKLNLLPNPGPIGAKSAPMDNISILTIGAENHPVVNADKCLKNKTKCLKKKRIKNGGEHSSLDSGEAPSALDDFPPVSEAAQ